MRVGTLAREPVMVLEVVVASDVAMRVLLWVMSFEVGLDVCWRRMRVYICEVVQEIVCCRGSDSATLSILYCLRVEKARHEGQTLFCRIVAIGIFMCNVDLTAESVQFSALCMCIVKSNTAT